MFNPTHTRIVNNTFLLEDDTKYGGMKPKRSFLGDFYDFILTHNGLEDLKEKAKRIIKN